MTSHGPDWVLASQVGLNTYDIALDDLLEDVSDNEEEESTPPAPKTVSVLKDKWVQLNAQAPIWMR